MERLEDPSGEIGEDKWRDWRKQMELEIKRHGNWRRNNFSRLN